MTSVSAYAIAGDTRDLVSSANSEHVVKIRVEATRLYIYMLIHDCRKLSVTHHKNLQAALSIDRWCGCHRNFKKSKGDRAEI